MKVLIAEDDPITSHLLQALVSKAGYEPVAVGDGSEVFHMMDQSDGPRLMILDWMMPNVDGIEVCRKIRQNTAGHYRYLILLTVKGKREEIIEGLDAGADDYVTKPFDFHELVARLRAGKRILELQDQLLNQATHDSLTGLLNRDAILDVLQKESMRSRRKSGQMAAILADIDHFKGINDAHGHLAGDAVLREVSRRILGSLRSYDSAGRYGGEEFLVVVPDCGMAEAAELAERLRNSVVGLPIETYGQSLAVTLSFGVADTSSGHQVTEILCSADTALYAAKKLGRNRVETCAEISAKS